RRVVDLPAVDARDDIAGLEAGLLRDRVALDGFHEHALLDAKVLGELRVERFDRHPQPSWTGKAEEFVHDRRARSNERARVRRTLEAVEELRVEVAPGGPSGRDVARAAAPAAEDHGRHAAPGCGLLHEPGELPDAAHAVAVEFGDGVAGLDPGLVRRTAGI